MPDQSAFGGGDQEMSGVTTWEQGLIAVGGESLGGCDAAVWTSSDGTTWTRVPFQPAFGGEGDEEMSGVSTWEQGLIAVGQDYPGLGNGDGAVWVSSDGTTWTRVPHQPAFGSLESQWMSGVTTWEQGLIAVGGDYLRSDGEDAVVWISSDGTSWTRIPFQPVFGEEGDQAMWGVTTWEQGLIAVGSDSLGGDLDAAVWITSE